jgi:UDP-glucuronate 4-epimerase
VITLIGNNQPAELGHFIEMIESEVGKKAVKNRLPMKAGDVLETFADIEDLKKETGFVPQTSLDIGIKKFVAWYKEYY